MDGGSLQLSNFLQSLSKRLMLEKYMNIFTLINLITAQRGGGWPQISYAETQVLPYYGMLT